MAAPPDPQQLLPPLLACLPTTFISPRPPPALLPLLSPILRQRIQYSGLPTGGDGWLPLLSWDDSRASRLKGKIEALELEPHPVSGEIEVEHTGFTQYRRLDEETLQVRFELQQYGLLPVYVWCKDDVHGGSGPGWKLAELRAVEDCEDGTQWFHSVETADEKFQISSSSKPLGDTQADQDDDDDYWNAYDRTPGRTPTLDNAANSMRKATPARGMNTTTTKSAEDSYYAGYDSVQPAMDNDDPDEDALPPQAPHRDMYNQPRQPQAPSQSLLEDDRPVQRSLYPADPPSKPSRFDSARASHDPTLHAPPLAPRPISPASSISDTSVERLEKSAAAHADLTRAEAGVKQFIGTEVRNLFRLARSVGMDVAEFREAVERELEVVSMLEDA